MSLKERRYFPPPWLGVKSLSCRRQASFFRVHECGRRLHTLTFCIARPRRQQSQHRIICRHFLDVRHSLFGYKRLVIPVPISLGRQDVSPANYSWLQRSGRIFQFFGHFRSKERPPQLSSWSTPHLAVSNCCYRYSSRKTQIKTIYL